MRDAVKGYLTLAAGLTEVTRQRATAAARALVASGEATAEQVGQLVEDLLEQSRSNREAVSALVTYEVDRTLGRLGLASNDEVAGLAERVHALEAELRRLRVASEAAAGVRGEPSDPPRPARERGSAPAADRPTGRAATRPSGKSAAGKKPPTKKAPGDKAAAKKAGARTRPPRATSGDEAPRTSASARTTAERTGGST